MRVQYRKLGRTGVDISIISLGAEHFVNVATTDVAAVIRKAIDTGINYIDLICGEPEVRDSYALRWRTEYAARMISGHLGAARKDGQCSDRDRSCLTNTSTIFSDALPPTTSTSS